MKALNGSEIRRPKEFRLTSCSHWNVFGRLARLHAAAEFPREIGRPRPV
jgi:hypothetical protein